MSTRSRLQVIRIAERDGSGTPTPGMVRAAGISGTTCGAEGLWMGYVMFEPGMESGAHHHGDNESGIYIISGRARFRFGEDLAESVEVGPGDFIHVPPHVVHVEGNLSKDLPVIAIVARNSQEAIVVNV